MTAGHTAGPWTVSQTRTRISVRGERSCIAGLQITTTSGRVEEGLANARLIAAAPDMIAALEAAEELQQIGLFDAAPGQIDRVNELRRAALLKASPTAPERAGHGQGQDGRGGT